MAAPVLRYGALDREHLIKHLWQLARRVGVHKVTMRELAAEAGTRPSSVYYHVRDKSELLDLLIESVLAQIEVPPQGDWETRLVTLYTNAWQVLVEVPGIAGLLQGHPHTAAATDMDRATRRILRESGLPAEQFEAAYAALYVHLLGSVQLEHVRPTADGPSDAAFSYGLRLILSGLRTEIKGAS
ncbi:TetR/AcrR family transcriptional regulator [Mycobacterium gordonae]|uniref:TetR family transcriptional regulator n=1 Tax=Mycobacterium gordonae TaxID=1778 RepID=A0A1X1W012_MYCGO|nr:TetR family transcriptional regulator [Mycobacterium gordonae]PJE10291.1 MAG: TetR family transcriptional regulator [Mycobacterium sp.]MCQ4363413.1 TetR family transcriptional regulator [Mycobacterium gordonae]MCV7009691.1 TetR family transcriptional regulator [Mycobacterium gordonae]ODR23717.1 TetR family transcriptional regulator [Mycobacterium gordonae]ORV77902.1 TetR family transcriptional regulator [Mycobacterium gordonae]